MTGNKHSDRPQRKIIYRLDSGTPLLLIRAGRGPSTPLGEDTATPAQQRPSPRLFPRLSFLDDWSVGRRRPETLSLSQDFG